ncbi:hypothetical protein [Bacillus thuringiensis]|uniref:hypothetical protein n=1 Tax=Bacillus thuringiensis TaxID=1428 RepID=UPI000BF8310D|nr:hypothetical protein [Bacillus thuringiensis]MEC0037243.1 hypothetical protein [Bacillus cereus]PEV88405.1 hypothetical protein CN442_20620 [Bacillus thuringiensis]PFK91039.1 hypothetical protein COJ04_21845 [Bacillus thuringiensis]
MTKSKTINVPIGAAIVEYGEGEDMVVFDITKGGISFGVSTSVQEVTVDQYGETPVKSIMKGRKAETTVPFALHDLSRLSKVMPNSKYVENGEKKALFVSAQAGFDMLSTAKKMVIKPTDPNATANDWITVPNAAASADPDYTYDPDNERIANITFNAFPESDGTLYILGDETVKEAAGKASAEEVAAFKAEQAKTK